MQFNPDKCEVIRITNRRGRRIDSDYTIHGTALREVSSAKYLGVTIDSKLTWNAHIANVTKKANNTRAFLQRNINRCPVNIKETCYKTFVRPSVEYASCVWDPLTAKNISAVEMVQRRTARFVTGEYRRTSSVSALIKTLGWHSLAHRRAMSRLTILYRVTHGLVDIPQDHLTPVKVTTRGSAHHFSQVHTRVMAYKHSFFPETVRLWNCCPHSLTSQPTLESFKSSLFKVDSEMLTL